MAAKQQQHCDSIRKSNLKKRKYNGTSRADDRSWEKREEQGGIRTFVPSKFERLEYYTIHGTTKGKFTPRKQHQNNLMTSNNGYISCGPTTS
jgi:hypothetical protein